MFPLEGRLVQSLAPLQSLVPVPAEQPITAKRINRCKLRNRIIKTPTLKIGTLKKKTYFIEEEAMKKNKGNYSVIIQLLAISILILGLSSCKQKKSAEIPGVLTVSGVGSVNFGKVSLGEVRTAGIKIDNQTTIPKIINLPVISAPFSFYIPGSTCGIVLNPNSSCIIAVRFSPIARNTYTQAITILEKTITFTGQGTDSGILSVVPAVWDIGDVAVGSQNTKRFSLTNTGDLRINIPSITNVNDYNISGTDCLTQILPGVTCYIDVTFQRNLAGSASESMRLFSDGSIYFDVSITNKTLPGQGDGVVLFSGVPATIVSDGNDYRTITITKVPDLYGNSVANGTACFLSGSNITFPDGASVIVMNGTSEFRIKSTTTRGTSSVSVTCDQAYGAFTIKSASDKAIGTITALPFNNSVRADGLAGITIKTDVIRDQYLNAINDGDTVYFELTGPGSLDRNSAQSYNGQSQVRVISGTSAGSAILKIRSNPIYTGATITGWGAESGDIVINFVAGYPSGTFPLATATSTIYSKPGLALGLVDESLITIGGITDTFGNPAGAGVRADVRVYGGKNKTNGLDVFTLFTGGDSRAYFTLIGNETRGNITVEVDIANTTQTLNVFASDNDINYYLPYSDRLKLYKTYGPSQFTNLTDSAMFPSASVWTKYLGDLSGIESKDTSHVGTKTFSGAPKELSYNFPRFIGNDCLQGVDVLSIILPCFYYTKIGATNYWGSSGSYTIGYNGELDILNITMIDKNLGHSTAHGSYATIYPMQTYHQASDSYVTYGGFQYTGTDAPYATNYTNNSSVITYPSSLLTQFDLMSYLKEPGVSDSIAFQSSFSEVKGDSYFYGGLKSDYKTSNVLNIIKKDAMTDTGILIEPVTIANHPTFGAPLGTIFSALYEDQISKRIYVIGGLKLVTGTWSFSDEIWYVDLNATNKMWDRLCNSCGLPVPSTTSLITSLIFPIPGANAANQFEAMSDYARKMEVVSDLKGKTYLFTEGEGVKEIFLVDGSTTTIVDPNILAMAGGNMIKINPLSGRMMTFRRGQKTTNDSKLWFFETPRYTKQFYMTEIQLPVDSKKGIQELNLDISGYASSKDEGGSEVFGMSAYIFNSTTLRWSLLGNSIAENESETSANPIQVTKTTASNVSQFVSNDDKVYILLTPASSPGCISGSCVSNGESQLKINYIEVNGVW